MSIATFGEPGRARRLRVLQVIPSLGIGGAEQMAAHLVMGLLQWHDVGVAALAPVTGSPIEQRLTRARVPMWHLGKKPGFDFRMFGALDRVITGFRPHIVHTHLSVLRYIFPVLLRRRVNLAVHTMHNVAERESDAVGRLLQWFAFRRCIRPVAISQNGATTFKRVYGLDCAAVVPNCIPVEEYRRGHEERVEWRLAEGFKPDDIVFICVGRLEAQKNPLLLLEAFAALRDPRAHLVFLGDGRLKDQLFTAIIARRLMNRVHLLGKRNDIPQCLAGSDVFVLSSQWEGNPLAVMEAMAAGLPVISTAVGGVPELIDSGRNGFLVPPLDRPSFTEAMRTLADDASRRTSMGQAAQAYAIGNFDLGTMARKYSILYRTACDASPNDMPAYLEQHDQELVP